MKIKLRALQNFQHGRLGAEAGNEYEFTKGDADDLIKAGLAEIIAEQSAPVEAADTKMAPEVQNKMEATPTNKAVTLTNTKTKAK